MPRLTVALLSCLFVITPPAWAADGGAKPRPLNLSLPRDILDTPGPAAATDETVERNLRAPAPAATPAAGRALPYGAGYEHRHRPFDNGGAGSVTGATGGGAAGGGAASGGAGGRRGR